MVLTQPHSLPLVEDSNFFLTSLDPDLFPGVDSSVQVHNGFKDAHASSAADVLSAVQSALSSTGTTNVAVVGHSLGAAIAILDTLYLSVQLGSSANVRAVGYGMPRVSCDFFYE
jgi:predicted lipase